MTNKDKLDKLVAEINRLRKEVKDEIAELGNSESERIGLFNDLEIYDNILSFIDSMQEEPKECMYSKDNYTDEDRKVLCEGCEEECGLNKKEYSVNKDLEEAIDTYLATYFGGEKEKQEWPFLKKMAVHFAEWKKQKDIIPVSEDLEKAARKYAGIPEDSPHDLKYCVQDKKAKYDAVLYGANLQKQQMMKEAVEGVVGEDSGGHLYAYIPLSEDCGLSYLDKVKVLVIKED